MTFIDLASLGCGRYEGFFLKSQFWPIVRRVISVQILIYNLDLH